MLNRRKLFSLFPLSLLGLATSAKAEPSSEWADVMLKGLRKANAHLAEAARLGREQQPEPNIWVETVCEMRFNKDGKKVAPPGEPPRPDSTEEHRARWERLFAHEVKDWDAAVACGQRYRHLRGENVICPRCESKIFAWQKGIPC